MYQVGESPAKMRVSNLNHETALKNALMVQDIEPKTWIKIQKRLKGMNTLKHIKYDLCPKTLPPTFRSWEEYRNFLSDKLPKESDKQKI